MEVVETAIPEVLTSEERRVAGAVIDRRTQGVGDGG